MSILNQHDTTTNLIKEDVEEKVKTRSFKDLHFLQSFLAAMRFRHEVAVLITWPKSRAVRGDLDIIPSHDREGDGVVKDSLTCAS